jgi:hypothetical protein
MKEIGAAVHGLRRVFLAAAGRVKIPQRSLGYLVGTVLIVFTICATIW